MKYKFSVPQGCATGAPGNGHAQRTEKIHVHVPDKCPRLICQRIKLFIRSKPNCYCMHTLKFSPRLTIKSAVRSVYNLIYCSTHSRIVSQHPCQKLRLPIVSFHVPDIRRSCLSNPSTFYRSCFPCSGVRCLFLFCDVITLPII